MKPNPGRRKLRWLLAGGAAAVVFCGMLAAGFWVLTSSWFLTCGLLPYLNRGAETRCQAVFAEWRPFGGELKLRGVTVRVGTRAPYLTIDELNLAYSWLDAIRGVPRFRSAVAVRARLNLEYDGANWNCVPDGPSGPEDPVIGLEIGNPRFVDSEIRLRAWNQQLRLTGVELGSDRYASHLSGRMTLRGAFELEGTNGLRLRAGRVSAALNGVVGGDLVPRDGHFELTAAELSGNVGGETPEPDLDFQLRGDFSRLKGGLAFRNAIVRLRRGLEKRLEARFDGKYIDVPRELELRLKTVFGDNRLGTVLCGFFWGINPGVFSGEFDGAAHYRENDFLSLKGGGVLRRTGSATVGDRQLELPAFTLTGKHDLKLDFRRKHAEFHSLGLKITENWRPTLTLNLVHPVQYDWGEAANAGTGAALAVELRQFDLRLLNLLPRPAARLEPVSGTLDAELRFTLPSGDPPAAADGSAVFRNVVLRDGDRTLPPLHANLDLRVEIPTRDQLRLRRLRIGLTGADNRTLGHAELRGTRDFLKNTAAGELRLTDFGISLLPYLPTDWAARLECLKNEPELRADGLLIGNSDPAARTIRCAELKLRAPGGDRLEIALNPLRIPRPRRNSAQRAQLPPLAGKLRGDLSGEWLGRGMTPAAIRVRGGRLRGHGNFQYLPAAKRFSCSGELELAQSTFEGGSWKFPDVGIQSDFHLMTAGTNMLELRTMQIFAQVGGKPAMRLEAPGSYNFADGSFEGKINLQYANENLLNLLQPGRFDNARLFGEAVIAYQGGTRCGDYSASLGIENLKLRRDPRAATGNLTLKATSSPRGFTIPACSGKLQFADAPFAQWRGSLEWPVAGTGEPVRSELTFRELNLGPFPDAPENRAAPAAVAATAAPPSKPPQFHFDRRWELRFNIEQLRRDNYSDGRAEGHLILDRNRIEFSPLRLQFLDGGLLESYLGFTSAPDAALEFTCRGQAARRVSLTTAARLLGWETGGCQAEVDKLKWQFGGRYQTDWELRDGAVEAELTDIEIPNEFATDPYGRVIFAPLEVLFRLRGLMPGRHWKPAQLTDSFVRLGGFKNHFSALQFRHGLLTLKLDAQKMQIENCVLDSGTPVARMRFYGEIPFDNASGMQIASDSTVGALQIPVDLRGPLDDPEVNLRDSALRMVSANALNFYEQITSLGGLLRRDAPPVSGAVAPAAGAAGTAKRAGQSGFWQKFIYFWD